MREHMIRINGQELHVREWPADGHPVVLAHGLASNARIWDEVAEALAPTHRVIAYDQRGHGRSSKPDQGYSFAEVTADLRALLDALEVQRPMLVGHSWGGNVALDFAARYPDALSHLVLVDGGFLEIASNPEMTWERTERDMAPPDLTHLTMAEMLERSRSRTIDTYWGPAVENTIRGSFEEGPDGRIRPRLHRERHMLILRAMWEHRPSQLYADVHQPTLVVPARRAPADEQEARRMAHREQLVSTAERLLPNGFVHWMDDTVHDIPLHRPHELAALLRDHLAR